MGPAHDTKDEASAAWNTRADSLALTAAVQGEREACARMIGDLPIADHVEARRVVIDGMDAIRSRGPAPAVDVMAVVRRLATARAEIKAIGEGPLALSMDAINAANERRRTFLAIVDELCALVDGKGEAKDGGAK